MNTVSVDGVVYTKAGVLAKKYGYTTDYIGQLCRSGKVGCQLVGRTWYVSEDSVLVHKNGRYGKVRLDEKSFINNVESQDENTERVEVRPVLTRTSAKLIGNQFPKNSHNFSPLRYEADEVDLLPSPLQSRAIPNEGQKLHTLPEEKPIKVKVISEKKTKQELNFTDIPAVSLRGQLTVGSFENDYISEEIKDLPLRAPIERLSDNDLPEAVNHLPEINENVSKDLPQVTRPPVIELSLQRSVKSYSPVSNSLLLAVVLVCSLTLGLASLLVSEVTMVSANSSASVLKFNLDFWK